jgi:hypothetical protein
MVSCGGGVLVGAAYELEQIVIVTLGENLGAYPPRWVSWIAGRVAGYLHIRQRQVRRRWWHDLFYGALFFFCFWLVPTAVGYVNAGTSLYNQRMSNLAYYDLSASTIDLRMADIEASALAP